MLLYMWNVDGLDQTKGAKIKDDINRYSPDMVIILETKKKLFQVETLLDLIDRDDQYHHLINSHSPGNIHGIAVMVSKKVHQFMDFRSLADQPFKLRCSPRKETLSHIKDATCGRILAVEISVPPHPPIVVVATYNPNSGADPRFPLKNLDYRINQWDPAMYQGLMELQGKYSHIIW